jgi:hypothetical protein
VGREVPAHTLLQKIAKIVIYVVTKQIKTVPVSDKSRGKLEPVLQIRGVYHGSRILIFYILDPGSRILDPTTATKVEGGKTVVLPILWPQISQNSKLFYFRIGSVTKKNLSQFT